MRPTMAPGTRVERLAQHILDGAPDDPIREELIGWLAGSARFRRFADLHRDKIRKKLRGATAAQGRRDVRAELRVAQLLLADRRIELAFEAYGSATGGPDFTVAFRGERAFNLEVTRPRRQPDAGGDGGILLAKLRQLPPSMPNAVLLAIEGDVADASGFASVMRALRARADSKDEAFFERRGFNGARDFYHRYLRLGAVLLWSERAVGDARAALWINRSARMALPVRAAHGCLSCLRADEPPPRPMPIG